MRTLHVEHGRGVFLQWKICPLRAHTDIVFAVQPEEEWLKVVPLGNRRCTVAGVAKENANDTQSHTLHLQARSPVNGIV